MLLIRMYQKRIMENNMLTFRSCHFRKLGEVETLPVMSKAHEILRAININDQNNVVTGVMTANPNEINLNDMTRNNMIAGNEFRQR